MRENVFLFVISLFFAVLCSWCTMMPSDEEIIDWSILENEIFWDELIDDGLDRDEGQLDLSEESFNENIQQGESNDTGESNEDEYVQVELVV